MHTGFEAVGLMAAGGALVLAAMAGAATLAGVVVVGATALGGLVIMTRLSTWMLRKTQDLKAKRWKRNSWLKDTV